MQKLSYRARLCGAAALLALALPAGATPPAAAAPPTADATRDPGGDRDAPRSIDAAALVQHVRDTASDLVLSAMNFLGVPYRRGGTSLESGFDCSGFTRYIFENTVGLMLPHRADEQARSASLFKISRADLRPGDLVFFNTMRRTFSHVGIYIGDDKFVHAPKPGAEVRIDDLREAYWARRFTGARRANFALLPKLTALQSLP